MKAKPKNRIEIEKMRAAGKLAGMCLDFVTPKIKPGISTQQIDDWVAEFAKEHNAICAPLNYRGFPKSVCTSVNEVVCHGIPNEKHILKDGDIINVDVTLIVNGFHGDTSRMFYVGNVSDERKKLISDTYDAMMAGIKTIKSGSWLSDIGKAIEAFAGPKGYGIVREYCGHGIGREFHTEPQVMHYAYNDKFLDMRLRSGMTFTVEPMINTGVWQTELDENDGWTVRTIDGKDSAQFEHTVLVTDDGFELLTASSKGWNCPPYHE